MESTQKNVPSSGDCAASHSHSQETKKEDTKTPGCVTNLSESPESVDPASLWLRMCMALLAIQTGYPTSPSKWNPSVITDTHCVFRLVPSELHTKGKGSSPCTTETAFLTWWDRKHWQTPKASDGTFVQSRIEQALELLFQNQNINKDSTIDEVRLNPEFVAWLMGVRPELYEIICECSGMESNTKQDTLSQQQ